MISAKEDNRSNIRIPWVPGYQRFFSHLRLYVIFFLLLCVLPWELYPLDPQIFSMWDSLLFNLDSLAGFYQGFIVCGEKSRVAKGDKLPRRGGGGEGGGAGGMFPEKFVK